MIDALPMDADVIVVEDGEGRIVACSSLFARDHVEFTWIDAAHRGHPGTVRQLLDGIRQTARRRGTVRLLTASEDEDALMTHLLGKLGAERLPGIHFVWPIGRES